MLYIIVFSIVFVYGVQSTQILRFHDSRANYPSLENMMVEDSATSVLFKPTILKQPVVPVSSTSSEGFAYLEFYSAPSCSGSITYSTGYREGMCLPTSDYVRPPLTDEDDFYYKFPFQSLRISNLTDSCIGWYTTYYTDLNCTDVYNVATVTDFSTCRSATELDISNMLSVRGKCSFAQELPVSATSFVVSDYVGQQNCSQNELKKFTAYGVDTCFGNGNFSSTLFSGNASTNAVHETQFYSSTNCTRSADQYGQSDYTILTDSCNAVQSPTAPSEDDSIAHTNYIGLSLVVVPPAPTARPTPAPSRTAAPTQNNLIYFSAKQTIAGISLSTYNSDASLYSSTLRSSIAACMTGVSGSNIINLVVSSIVSSSSNIALLRAATTSSIGANYEVSVQGSALSYSSLSSQLSSAVQSGQFDSYLHTNALQSGAVGFSNATSSSVSTEDLEDSGSDDDKGLNNGVIAGIALACAAFVLLVGVAFFFYLRSPQGSSGAGAAASPSLAATTAGTCQQSNVVAAVEMEQGLEKVSADATVNPLRAR